MDPVTAIITAVVAGAAAAAQDTASDAIKGSYEALKNLLSKHLSILPRLEKDPSEATQQAAAKELSESEIKNDPEVAKAAHELSQVVARDTKPGTFPAVYLERLSIAGEALVQGNVGGVIARHVVAQKFTVVGNSPGN